MMVPTSSFIIPRLLVTVIAPCRKEMWLSLRSCRDRRVRKLLTYENLVANSMGKHHIFICRAAALTRTGSILVACFQRGNTAQAPT
jgi:hypothetical protein